MNNNYKKAPKILTSKDLNYLKDLFGWNYTNYKFLEDHEQFIDNKEIINLFKDCKNFFYDNMNLVLDVLEQGGKND